jgi:hypothetical protein
MLSGRFFRRPEEPAMNKMLVAALLTACAVNMACVFGHLSGVAG